MTLLQFEDLPLYPKEGTESLFETPALDSIQRTSYKKGPISSQYRPSYIDRLGTGSGISGFDYNEPYYEDPYNYAKSAFSRNGHVGNRLSDYPRRKIDDGPYYQTTPGYKYSRSRYRSRNGYPVKNRSDRIRERNTETQGKQNIHNNKDDNIVTTTVEPLAMREKRKVKVLRNSKYLTKKIRSRNIFSQKSLSRSRARRHVGPHDEDGLQRLLSTGSLAPSSLPKTHPNYNHSIDFLFATYWFFPAKTRAILPEDQKCIEKKMSDEQIRFDPKSEYLIYQTIPTLRKKIFKTFGGKGENAYLQYYTAFPHCF